MKGYFEKRRIAYGALAALFLVSPEVATAGERSTETPECKEITARIMERTNTHFDHFSPSGGSVFFKGPDMVLICDPKFVTYVSLNWDASGFPPNDWFALAATAGSAVTALIRRNWKRRRIGATVLRSRKRRNKLASLFPVQRLDVRRSPEMEGAWSLMSRYPCGRIEIRNLYAITTFASRRPTCSALAARVVRNAALQVKAGAAAQTAALLPAK
ncbi:hypothetical protein IVB27_08755 [Bradyrhizobium sp. 197]|uniref:hypothetical protein n=1 Tax=unclassified Bradyrhizobium TaxID=2631580 RepID=UPI001FFB39DB|nr:MULTISPECIES: hypothetical protein [unclassified Bradyrhizobium]MCK1474895.1 hypothetical protein [Bradyrhizobium sp. 197]UPJ57644.1 hypothetical protein IVB24_34695 [Bradyrhizobium sp. 192]